MEWRNASDSERIELIRDYSLKVRELKEVLTSITGSYCANDCGFQDKVGCCDAKHYVSGMNPDLLSMQIIESGITPNYDDGKKCDFHSEKRGCELKNYVSPFCLGVLCEELQRKTESIDKEVGKLFNGSMESLSYGSMFHNGKSVLVLIDKAIDYGRHLEQILISK